MTHPEDASLADLTMMSPRWFMPSTFLTISEGSILQDQFCRHDNETLWCLVRNLSEQNCRLLWYGSLTCKSYVYREFAQQNGLPLSNEEQRKKSCIQRLHENENLKGYARFLPFAWLPQPPACSLLEYNPQEPCIYHKHSFITPKASVVMKFVLRSSCHWEQSDRRLLMRSVKRVTLLCSRASL